MVLSVSQAIEHLNSLIKMDEVLSDVCVLGEVSRVSKASSGHCYFALRDADATLDAVVFNGGSGIDYVETGQEIFVFGRFSVYPIQGRLQLISNLIQPSGVGALQAKFEKIRSQLKSEGLFEDSRKRPLPEYPTLVGVVTSADSAAWEDIKRTASVRYPAVCLKLAHTLVQGEYAAEMIADAVRKIGMIEEIDSIILARGGGSPEDLWSFNEEIVAKAIFAAPVPVVTGIGHETDWTIADLVADLRASTPTSAVMQLLPDSKDIKEKIYRIYLSMITSTKRTIDNMSFQINDFVNRSELSIPDLDILKLRLDDLVIRSESEVSHNITLPRKTLEGILQNLNSLGPLNTVARGYSIVRTVSDGTVVNSQGDVGLYEDILITLIDGEINAKVTGKNISNGNKEDFEER